MVKGSTIETSYCILKLIILQHFRFAEGDVDKINTSNAKTFKFIKKKNAFQQNFNKSS